MPAQLRKGGEGAQIETRHDDPAGIDIARTAAAALAEKDQGQPLLIGQAQHAVHFLVVEESLGSGQHHVVVSHYHAPGLVVGDQAAIDGADSRDQSVGRCSADEVVHAAPLSLSGHSQGAVLDDIASVQEILDVFTRGPLVFLMPFRDGIGTVLVQAECMALDHLGQFGADTPGFVLLVHGPNLSFAATCLNFLKGV